MDAKAESDGGKPEDGGIATNLPKKQRAPSDLVREAFSTFRGGGGAGGWRN
jgi:hypothetical protein